MFENLHQLPSYSLKSGILQVLDLEGCKSLNTGQLDKLCKMFHLKYLSLRRAYIKKLPAEIGKLQYLETLDIREADVVVGVAFICWEAPKNGPSAWWQ